jgi:hypothetical protein
MNTDENGWDEGGRIGGKARVGSLPEVAGTRRVPFAGALSVPAAEGKPTRLKMMSG